MVYDAYDRGISRNNSQDAAARVANEIFHHDLNQATMETRGMLQNASGRDAQVFVNRVDQDLAQLNRTYGQQSAYGQYGENQVGNFLSARQTYDSYGRAVEHIDMVSGDRIHHRSVADVPIQPYGRVPMNFNQFQPGEAPRPSYYANQSPYMGFQNPVAPPSSLDYAGNNPNYYAPNNPNYYAANNPNYYNYGNSNYDYQQPVPIPVPMPVSYGYGGYYHRHVPYGYGYGGGYGYEGYPVNTSIAAGAIIGGTLARVFRI
jgi:hypothetical protein